MEINPEKTKIVYYQRNNEKIEGETTQFAFLAYCFRPRMVKSKTGTFFMGFTPAVNKESSKTFCGKIKDAIYQSHTTDIVALSRILNEPNHTGMI